MQDIPGLTEIDIQADLTGFWEVNSKLLLQQDEEMDWNDLPDIYSKSFR